MIIKYQIKMHGKNPKLLNTSQVFVVIISGMETKKYIFQVKIVN